MGIYYKIVCDEKRESIDPGFINDLGNKSGSIAHPEHPFGAVSIYAMLHRWYGCQCRIVGDESGDDAYDFPDVTKEVIEDYNDFYRWQPRPLLFTGGDT